MMNFSNLKVTTAGINFSVRPTFRFGNQRKLSTPSCFISNETLDALAVQRRCKAQVPEQIFRELEREIAGAAARLSLALSEGSTLVLRTSNFSLPDN